MKKLVFALVLLVGCSNSTQPQENLWIQWTSNTRYAIIHRESCKCKRDRKADLNDCAKIEAEFKQLGGEATPCQFCKPCQ